MIRFTCVCGRLLYGREEDVGRTSQCVDCDVISIIPAGDSPAPIREDGVHADAPTRVSREDSVDSPRRGERDREPTATSAMATAALWFGISALFLLVTAIPGAICGVLALREISKSRGSLSGKGMAVTGLVLSGLSVLLVFALMFVVANVRANVAQLRDANNLKHMALAMHNYHDSNGGFPQVAAYQDANGKPLLSWRVALLPYIEEYSLHKRFRLDEPWDSPNNKALLPRMPRMYALPGDPNPGSGKTHYQVFVGPGTAFEARKDRPVPGQVRLGWMLSDFSDNRSDTILIATSATPVPWTKPDDIPFSPNGPIAPLGGHLKRGYNIAFADGCVKFFPQPLPDETLRAAITRNGGEVVTFP